MRIFLDIDPPKSTMSASYQILKNSKTGKSFVGVSDRSNARKTKRIYWNALSLHRPKEPLEGPLVCAVTWVYPWRTSETKKVRAQGIVPKPTAPDLDNMAKGLLDCMAQIVLQHLKLSGYYRNDAQIYHLTLSKFWGDNRGVTIDLETTDSTD